MKKCINCGELKLTKEYYVHSGMADGHLNKCKTCVKAYNERREQENRNNIQWVEQERARHRDKYYRLNYRGKHKPDLNTKKIAIRQWKDKYPEKYEAHISCQRIKAPADFQKHHWSYNKIHFKSLIVLSVRDHALAHRYLEYDKNEKMYKSVDGLLLNSKQKHVDYLLEIGVSVLNHRTLSPKSQP